MRSLTELELIAVRTLASEVSPEDLREQLEKDLEHCSIIESAPDGSIWQFHIDGHKHGPYRGQDTFRGRDRFPVEGEVRDSDGGAVDVYIYVVNGRIYELELLRPDGHEVIEPRWQTFKSKSP